MWVVGTVGAFLVYFVMMTTSELMRQGLAEVEAGRAQAATILFGEVLGREPRNGEALFHLAVITKGKGGVFAAVELLRNVLVADALFTEAIILMVSLLRPIGKIAEALPFLRAAIEGSPEPVQLLLVEVNLLLEVNQIEEAISCLDAAVIRFPEAYSLHERLAQLLSENKRHEEALVPLRRGVELCPISSVALCALGNGLDCLGRQTEALDCFATAVHLDPDSFVALHLLGTGLFEKKEYGAAIDAFRKALQVNPGSLHTLSNLGVALVKTAQFEEGVEMLRFVVTHQASLGGAWLNLSIALRELGEITASLEASQKALELNPGSSEVLLQRSASLLRAGFSEEAAGCLFKAHQLDPKNAEVHSDFLFASNYLSGLSATDRFLNYRQFSELHEVPLKEHYTLPGNNRDPDRKLRVGYVSGDLCLHSVGFFVEPIFRAHDRTKIEVFAYSNRPRQDRITDLLQSLSDHWREVHAISDEAFEALVRYDKIDILVDLSGHTARNRLKLFARRPAPVQITMVGCMQTTGLDSVDYRITDNFLDPVGLTEVIHSEKLLRLSGGAFVFTAPPNAPEVNAVPCVQNGYITFGSFNNSAKVTPDVLKLWSQVLASLPDSRLVLVGEKDNIAGKALVEMGIRPERLTILERQPVNDYLKIHQEVDVLLDTFPYNGLTVTLLAAWMGVPCLTLEGKDAAARAGSAINTRLGLNQFVAQDSGRFIQIAKEISLRPELLVPIRAGLRNRTREVYGDGERYTRELEDLFATVWGRWSQDPVLAAPEERFNCEQRTACARHLLAAGLELEAALEFNRVLEEDSNSVEALEALSNIALRQDQPKEAEDLLNRILLLDPQNIAVLEALSSLVYRRGGYEAMEEFYKAFLKLHPNNSEVLSGLGDVYRRTSRMELATQTYRQALDNAPGNVNLRDLLANHLLANQKMPEAALALLKIDEAPAANRFSAWMTAGSVFFTNGKLVRARDAFRKAIALRPYDMDARANLGAVLKELFQTEEAAALLRASLRINPLHVESLNNFGNALQQMGESAEAENAFTEAIKNDPNSIKAHINLGGLLVEFGRNQEAIEYFRKALALDPNSVAVASNLCFILNYLSDTKPTEIFSEYRRFGDSFETPFREKIASHLNDKSPERRLRVGYISADFRDHSVAYFVEPLIRGHNREKVEVFCYYNFAIMDPVTQRLHSYADHWRSIHCVSDETIEQQIREDGIDILVELSGHTSGSRLLLFARKPAPIQVTMIGCMQSSGLVGMDYRITDSWLDPEGLTEHIHTEKLIRLKSGAFCLEPLENAPDVNALPALENGFIRFASFNNLAKVTKEVVSAWARILHRIPNSRLLVVGRGPERISALFGELGIDSSRIDVSIPQEPDKYLGMHHEVDVILDSFPYNGLTITSLAAWMGVPCITIEGDCAASRAGSAIMRRLGLPEFVAKDESSYVDVAENVVFDLGRLSEIRSGLRSRCRARLANTEVYVAEVEAEYRKMWKTWCEV